MSPRSTARRRRAVLALAVAATALVATACGSDPRAGADISNAAHRFALIPGAAAAPSGSATAAVLPPTTTGTHPNIVFVLTDDLSWNLVRFMPHVQQLMRQGMTFTNYTVTDSLCCPSRASILTGDFPHDTGVYSNSYPDGGYYRFEDDGMQNRSYAVSLATAGYTNAFAGKYLNQYQLDNTVVPHTVPVAHESAASRARPGAVGTTGPTVLRDYAPPGWSNWGGVDGGGYAGYGYGLALPHSVLHFGHRPADYMTTVLGRFGHAFVANAVARHRPFALELASFAPHSPYVPAPQDVGTFPQLRLPRGGAYDRPSVNPAGWLAARSPLTHRQMRRMDRFYRLRAESVQAVDRMIGRLRAQLAHDGQLRNTYFVFSSDNGFHMGDYRLSEGKQTPYDTDVRVPLVVTGPGVPAGTTNPAVTENIDLAPTFEQIAGVPVPPTVDGASMLPLWHGKHVPWRTVALVEHRYATRAESGPDSQNPVQGTPPTYQAIRTARFTYVRYADGEHAYFDRTRDPYELDNTWPSLSPARQQQLDAELNALVSCHGTAPCWAAGRPSATSTVLRNP